MQKLSRFVDEDELAHMSFDELTNNITIKDSRVNIPNMSIKSNVSNIELSGWHTFDQKIDYHLKVPLRKAYKKDKDERFGEILEDEETITNLFLKITGTTDDYKISYDQKKSLENVSKQIKAEGKELIEAIKTKGANLNKKATIQLEEGDYFDFDTDTLATDSIQ